MVKRDRNGTGERSVFVEPAFVPAALIIVLLAVAAYVPAMRNGFIWDDDAYVVNNESLRSVEGLRQIWLAPRSVRTSHPIQYYPVVQTAFWLQYHLWGFVPLGYHAVNVVLHALNAVFLLAVLRRLGVRGSFLAAVVFALHPVHVESVAWITELKNVLSAFFYLLSLQACLRCFELGAGAARPTVVKKRAAWVLALAFFVLALLSKTVTASLPAVVLLLIWWKRGRVTRDEFKATWPMFAAGLVMAGVTVYFERAHVGAGGIFWRMSFLERVLVAGRALWFYADKLLLPRKLVFIYPRWQVDASVWWQYVYPAAAVAVVVWLWMLRRQIGRGPVVAVLIFAGTLFPALGFFNTMPMLYSFVADHFQYLASAALLALVAAVVEDVLGQWRTWGPRVRAPLYGVLMLTLGVLTGRQCLAYRNVETLWRSTLERNPSCWMAHVNLGRLLSQRGEADAAVAEYEAALRIWPGDPGAHNNLAIELMNRGDLDGAQQHLEIALNIWSGFAMAHNNLGLVLQRRGRLQDAARSFGNAIRLNPNLVTAHYNMGTVLAQLGAADEALAFLRRALEIDPSFFPAHLSLSRILWGRKELDEAARHGEAAVALCPGQADAHYVLAMIRIEQGRADEARDLLKKAIVPDMDFSLAHYRLALVLFKQGQVEEAVEHAREAVRFAPNRPETLNALAWMIATQENAALGDPAEALRLARAACALTGFKQPNLLDTLAVAQAAAGDCEAAAATARDAADLAKTHGDEKLRREILARGKLYAAGRPYRESFGEPNK